MRRGQLERLLFFISAVFLIFCRRLQLRVLRREHEALSAGFISQALTDIEDVLDLVQGECSRDPQLAKAGRRHRIQTARWRNRG